MSGVNIGAPQEGASVKIFYFTGTGNCLAAAKALKARLANSVIYNISELMRHQSESVIADAVVLIYPSYAYEMPVLVRRFIRRTEFVSPYIAALVTYGSHYGGALAEAKRLLKRKKLPLSFAGAIPSVENFVALFGRQKPEKIAKRLAMHNYSVENIAKNIEARKTNTVSSVKLLSSLVSIIFRTARPLLRRMFSVSRKRCKGCGICQKVCPVGAVTLKRGRPRFGKGCQQCQACIHWCPQGAIRFLRKRSYRSSYHNPEVEIAELIALNRTRQ